MSTTVDDLMRRLERAEAAREAIVGTLGRIETTLGHHGLTLAKIETRVTTLEAEGQRREGREGVFSALLRSPLAAWLAAGVAAAWAFASRNADAG